MFKPFLTNKIRGITALATILLGAGALPHLAIAQEPDNSIANQATYADLVEMSELSTLVARVEIRRQTVVKPERAPGLAPGFARLYIEARTVALIAGQTNLGEAVVYLADVPLTAKGKAPKLKKRQMILFARTVAGRPGELQLIGPAGQMDYSPQLEARLRPILTELIAPDSPPIVTGVSDALSVPGTLAGESETQIFLETESGEPVSFTVLRRPRQPAVWGVSWGEIIDQAARPPQGETLAWYRLACALPRILPSRANLARDPRNRRLAEQDYSLIIAELGPCERQLTADTA